MNESSSNCKEIARVDLKKCNACGTCLDECPYDAITIAFNTEVGDGRAAIDPVRCTGCGSCAEACSRKALSLESMGTSP